LHQQSNASLFFVHLSTLHILSECLLDVPICANWIIKVNKGQEVIEWCLDINLGYFATHLNQGKGKKIMKNMLNHKTTFQMAKVANWAKAKFLANWGNVLNQMQNFCQGSVTPCQNLLPFAIWNSFSKNISLNLRTRPKITHNWESSAQKIQ